MVSISNDAADERKKSDQYLAVLKKRMLIGVAFIAAIWAYFHFSDSSQAKMIKSQLRPIAERLDTAQKTGDRPTVLALYEPMTKTLNDFAELSESTKAEINAKPLRYCYLAAVNLSNGLSEVMQTGQWLTRTKYTAALDMCE